jgi:hypothetical protein
VRWCRLRRRVRTSGFRHSVRAKRWLGCGPPTLPSDVADVHAGAIVHRTILGRMADRSNLQIDRPETPGASSGCDRLRSCAPRFDPRGCPFGRARLAYDNGGRKPVRRIILERRNSERRPERNGTKVGVAGNFSDPASEVELLYHGYLRRGTQPLRIV